MDQAVDSYIVAVSALATKIREETLPTAEDRVRAQFTNALRLHDDYIRDSTHLLCTNMGTQALVGSDLIKTLENIQQEIEGSEQRGNRNKEHDN
jgi:hypothetical protein